MRSKARALGASAALVLAALAPARRRPRRTPPCSETSGYGTIAQVDSQWVSGRWYNCAGGTTDRVFIEVNNASDSPCISVPYGSSGGVGYDPYFFVAFVNHDATWRRC